MSIEQLQVLRKEQSLRASDIKLVELEDETLVIDRMTGRWLLSSSETAARINRYLDPHAAGEDPAVSASLRDAGMGQPLVDSPDAPLGMLILKLTNACNLGCLYCYDYDPIHKATVADKTSFERAIAQALRMCGGKLRIILHGGEPTLVWPLIEGLVEFAESEAKALGVAVAFGGQTNLTKLNARIVQFSVDHGIAWGISIDGPPAVNDTYRVTHRGGGSHAIMQKHIEAWPEFVASCGAISTVTSANVKHLVEVAHYIKSLRIRAWDWTLFQPSGRGATGADSAFSFDVGSLMMAWRNLYQGALAGDFDGFAVRPVLKYLYNFLYGSGAYMCLRPKCGAGRELASITADGVWQGCDCIDRSHPCGEAGNVDEVDLATVRAGPGFEALRSRDLSEAAPCNACPWYSLCGGTCLAYGSDLTDRSLLHCAMAQYAYKSIAQDLSADPSRILRYMASVATR
ncbi:radical SAM protein [Luteimonas sp. RC10]|uniref:radical SAM/SPASM domain-containing protein n=1 Tax=Luteimonas sp. RC10 TaxID=2587035 RepID=UPI00161CB503|nr:radical SAM protein [Luteimonas sp. RC10]MBB3342687.1 uncharacterized protein [Luteimonas sp. RC10]